jgi:hypothetical protein
MSYGSDYSRWGNRQTALTKRSIDTPSGRISYTEAGSGPMALFVSSRRRDDRSGRMEIKG